MAKFYATFVRQQVVTMKDIQIIQDREQSRRQEILDIFLTDVELFRTKATKAYKIFSNKERIKLEKIEAKNIPSYQVLAKWESDLKPLLEKLEIKKSDNNFKKIITKNFFLNDNEVQRKTDQLIESRIIELIYNFVHDIYPINGKKDRYRYERDNARKLFSLPIFRIQLLKDHQVDYLLFREVASQNRITVNDPGNWFIIRILDSMRIRKQRKKIIKFENMRLTFIKTRLDELEETTDGLITEIIDKKWDLMIVLGFRNQYEKRINELSKEDKKNAVKRLAIFDKETTKFREEQTEKIALNSDQAGLEITRKITKDIDALLLRIFDLTNIQKNQLVLQMKEYRELTNEKASIFEKQENRKKQNR